VTGDAECPGARFDAASPGALVRDGLAIQDQVEITHFHTGDAAEAPARQGHAFGQEFLGGAVRIPFAEKFLAQEGQISGIFAGEKMLFSGQAMQEAIPAGHSLAFRGTRSGRLPCVVTIGVYLRLSSHVVHLLTRW
jgi:hypothetical protein